MKLLSKIKWRPSWKTKWFLSILCGVLLVILILFGTSYTYLTQKIIDTNEKMSLMSFQETEQSLKGMLKNAEHYLSQFGNNELAWEYSANTYETTVEKSVAIQAIVQRFDQMMYADTNIYGFGILSGDGRNVVSTAEKKSRSGVMKMDENIMALLKDCKENYPFVKWVSGDSLDMKMTEAFYCLVNRPVLLGIMALGEAENAEEDSYLCVALDERKVGQSYGAVSYNGSRAALVDENDKIISSTDSEYLETTYKPREEDQNIEYDLSYHNWKLVNMIPKNEYLREVRGIKKMGFLLGGIAALAVLFFCLIWNRKYTRPIQILMDQMEMVGKEQLDIENPEKVGWPELDHLNEEFYHTVQKLKTYISRLQTAEQEKAKEELLALQYQINPHFLYNSLNSIRWMAMMTNNTKVADSLVILCKVIMPILRNPSFTWKLSDELDFLENYIKMMRIRYGNEMEYHLQCEDGIQDEDFPRFIIQPVMENCFVHGSSSAEVRHIYLRIRKTERFAIEVQNTGSFIEPEKVAEVNRKIAEGTPDGESIGLCNIRKRLNLLYGEKGDIWLESSPERGVLVYICF